MDTVYLSGSNEVEKAGRNIAGAADQMTRAAESVASNLAQHEQFMSDWLAEFQRILTATLRERVAALRDIEGERP